LPSIEEALKILAGALQAASQAGLDKVEVQRLQAIATLARTYEQLVSRYIDYRGIEVMLIEMREKYEALVGQMQRQPRQWGNDGNKSLEAHGGNG
jgi:maleate cis-trans isomerase